MTEAEALEFLRRDGNLRVPCSRYGGDTFSCAPTAYRLAELIADATGEPITEESLDRAMGLVVNNHDDVAYLLIEHGGTPEDHEKAGVDVDASGVSA